MGGSVLVVGGEWEGRMRRPRGAVEGVYEKEAFKKD